jgi:hypothetical protein
MKKSLLKTICITLVAVLCMGFLNAQEQQRRAPSQGYFKVEAPTFQSFLNYPTYEPSQFRGDGSDLIYATSANDGATGVFKTTVGTFSQTPQQLSTITLSYQAMEHVDGVIYVATYDGNTNANTFGRIDPNTGAFTLINGSNSTAPDAVSMALHPITGVLYVTQWAAAFGTVNTTTGVFSSIASKSNITYIAIDNDGTCYALQMSAADSQFGTMNLTNGTFTQISTYPGGNWVQDICIDLETGILYHAYRGGVTGETTKWRTINKTTGAYTELGAFPVGRSPESFVIMGAVSCPPPSNLAATYTASCGTNLTWTAGAGALSYNVYRGDDFLANITGTSYTDNGAFNPSIPHTWKVASVCNGEESSAASVTLASCNGCASTINFAVEYVNDCDALLTWGPPSEQWIRHSVNDVISGSLGLGATVGGDFSGAVRFTPQDFAAKGVTNGQAITKLGLGMGTQLTSVTTMQIKIWEGGTSVTDPGILMYTQPITNYTTFTENTMTEIMLNTPYVIDITKELRIEWNVVNTAGYPLGRDAGPNVAGKGGLLYLGGNWIDISLPPNNMNFNFSMKAWVEGEVIITDVFNIYRDGALIASNVAGTSYLDQGFVATEGHTWGVATVCGGYPTTPIFVEKPLCSFGDCYMGEAIVGTATTTTYDIPINTFYSYSYTQQIFTVADLGINCGDLIHEVSFEYIFATSQGPGGKNNQSIYLGVTTKNEFSGTSDWVPVAELQRVFSGTVQYNNLQQWTTITFDEPFVYEGGNLVLAVLNNHGGYNTSSSPTFRMSPAGGSRTLHYRKDGVPVLIDLTALPAATGMLTNRNNTRFGTCEYSYNIDMAALGITGNLTPMATESNDYVVTVKNFGALPANNYTVRVVTEDGTVLATETVTTPLVPNGTATHTIAVVIPQVLSGGLKIKAVVTIAGDQNACNNETPYIGLTVTPHPGYVVDCSDGIDVQVGAGTLSLRGAPIDNWNGNSYSQQIYDATEIGEPGVINAISFNYTHTVAFANINNINVYLKNTTKINFTGSTNWEPVSGADLVFSGNLTISNGWITFTFDTPFDYEGDNIIVTVHKTGTWTGSSTQANWQYTTTNDNKTMWVSADNAIYNPGGITQTGTAVATRPNARFTFCEKQYTLNPWDTYGTGAEVTMVPNPVPHGQDATVYFGINNDCYYIENIIIDGVPMGVISEYTFYNVETVLPVIDVITQQYEYQIVATHGPNGTIDPVGNVSVNCGETMTFQLIRNPGFNVNQVIFNGEDYPVSFIANSWTTPAITDPTNTFHVTFVEAPYKINVSYDPTLGEVLLREIEDGQEVFYSIPPGIFGANEGFMYQFMFVPSYNADLTAVTVDGILRPGAVTAQTYIFPSVFNNHTLNVEFTVQTFIITATAGNNGDIDPAGNVTVAYGSSPIFNFTPNVGYYVDQVFVNQANNPEAVANGYYIFEDVTENQTIYVTFARMSYQIHVTSFGGSGGATEPTGEFVTVFHNEHQIFYFIPEEGYQVTSVIIDGISYPDAIPTGSYTFYYVTTNGHTIHVTFEKIPYPITAMSNGNGIFIPSTDEGTTYVPHGTNKTYMFEARPGYEIVNVFVDGINNLAAVANGYHTFENVTAPHTINVITALRTYTITASAGANGFISPVGVVTASYGQNRSFTFAPAGGYEIDQVLIDGIENGEAALNGAYVFLNITDDHTIHVTFKQIRLFIRSSAVGSGVIDPFGVSEIPYGEAITYTITPDNGYEISKVFVNGNDMGAISTYTFAAVDTDGDIEAIFVQSIGIDNPTIDGISVYSQKNDVYIVNNSHLPIQDVSIMDAYGRVVWQGKVTGNKITLDVANGIYMVRVMTNEQFTTTKVSIQR